MIISDIAEYEDTDSELAKYTIQKQQEEIEELHKLLEEKYYSGNAPKIIDIFHRLDKSTIEKQKEEIEKLTAESTEWESKFYNEAKKVDKAIEYIENNSKFVLKKDVGHFAIFYREMEDVTDLLEILEGEDK